MDAPVHSPFIPEAESTLHLTNTPRAAKRASRPQGEQAHREGERGSALVLAILVSVLLTLLGISFLFMSQTENLIARNEKLAAQAFYVAEAGARITKRWFDQPGALLPSPPPTLAQIDRSLRTVDDDGAGPLPPEAAGARGLYKGGVDLDVDGDDDIFRQPYRGDDANSLLGTEDGPDIRIEDEAFLTALSRDLLAGFPARNLEARIVRIDIYAPPYFETLGGWTRFGMATVSVEARIFRDEDVVAERTVKAVLNELPYPGPFGPLHSGKNITFEPELTTYWGPVTARGTVTVSGSLDDYPLSLPRTINSIPRVDTIWGFVYPFASYKSTVLGNRTVFEPGDSPRIDPWFRLLAGSQIVGLAIGTQPAPSQWLTIPNEPDACDIFCPSLDHSNLYQGVFVGCPEYDYAIWKQLASSGESNVRYFAYSGSPDLFLENGRGDARTFEDWTDGQEGIYFFDTIDGLPPADLNADGVIDTVNDNLTPTVSVGDGWRFKGVIYLNAHSFEADPGTNGPLVDMHPPAEPFVDENANGIRDSSPVENWIELDIPSLSTIDDSFDSGTGAGGPGWDELGNPVSGHPAFEGILYTNGRFEARGGGTYYGSIIAREGVIQESALTGTPRIYWNDSITGHWPPEDWHLPRVIITSWVTDF
jgi:hypothetical protein